MHIPDGFLSTNIWVPAWIFSATWIGFCVRKVSNTLKDKMIPLMGVLSAFIFAAQMINFPVIGGTSGHLMGAVLVAVLMGPWAGAIVIALVLLVQCLVFQDGGLTALGANIFTMSFAGCLGGFFIYNLLRRLIGKRSGIIFGTAVAAWISVVLGAVLCSFGLALSGTAPFRVTIIAMVGTHSLIGIGEAIISCLIVSFVMAVRPDLIYNDLVGKR